ncbi:endonuclease/exonuclease/phosphatase family protein [Terrarubrum flagellatum]|uniref:endonuclease/exonuclease/phosphatase family protein n=1 Tax=Terrirubrum flagellatum TaxID=2895980 RepID=UPI003144F5A0
MRPIVDTLVSRLEPASPDALRAARGGPRTEAHHRACCDMVPAIDVLEFKAPAKPATPSARLRVAAWNAERCMFPAPSRKLLSQVDADIVLLTEMDQGMARANNLHTTAEMAADGAGFIFGVEFVELGRGSMREATLNPHLENSASFHGNAILSRLRLADAFMARLDDGGAWYHGSSGDHELRLAGRNAIVARIEDAPFPLWVASIHLESASDADDRARQTKRLLDVMSERIGDAAAIIGGDFNTNELRAEGDYGEMFGQAEMREPLFRHLREAGFGWATVNTRAISQRTRPDGEPRPPFARLDWLFVRGLTGLAPQTVAAIDAAGYAISDHELIAADFDLGE